MDTRMPIWLVSNPASRSNDETALARLEADCAANRLAIAGRTVFPGDSLPNKAELDRNGIGIVAVFAGDGTVNATLDHLAGWGGMALVLPGGTMNLIFHRLFGESDCAGALRAVASGQAKVRRPGMVRSPLGNAYAEALAGPGTAWRDVREAIRAAALVEVAADAAAAAATTLKGDPVACVEPPLGRREGYPLIAVRPSAGYLAVEAYHSESPGELLEQLTALVQRDFRHGPHETLGHVARAELRSVDGAPLGLLLDGEPAVPGAAVQFELARCAVDLLATVHDD